MPSTTARPHPPLDQWYIDPFAARAAQPDPVRRARQRMTIRRQSIAGQWSRFTRWLSLNWISAAIGTIGLIAALLVFFLFLRAVTPAPAKIVSTPTARPIVAVTPAPTPITLATVSAASINAAMRPDSQTEVISIAPLPQQQAAIDRQIVITQGLLAGGLMGWYEDNIAGQRTMVCPDSMCGTYNPNDRLYVCGGWLGVDSDKARAVFQAIKSLHVCVEAQRVSADDRSALGYISQSTRRALVGNTDKWPLLYVEIYKNRSPFPVDDGGEGK